MIHKIFLCFTSILCPGESLTHIFRRFNSIGLLEGRVVVDLLAAEIGTLCPTQPIHDSIPRLEGPELMQSLLGSQPCCGLCDS